MKSITIAGNIGRDAEVRRTQSGDPITGFTVAVVERRGNEKSTFWFDVSIFGTRGEGLAPYLRKGGKVCVSGDLGRREHDGKTYLSVRANEVTLMGGAQRQDYTEHDAPQHGQSADLDDEIPF